MLRRSYLSTTDFWSLEPKRAKLTCCVNMREHPKWLCLWLTSEVLFGRFNGLPEKKTKKLQKHCFLSYASLFSSMAWCTSCCLITSSEWHHEHTYQQKPFWPSPAPFSRQTVFSKCCQEKEKLKLNEKRVSPVPKFGHQKSKFLNSYS